MMIINSVEEYQQTLAQQTREERLVSIVHDLRNCNSAIFTAAEMITDGSPLSAEDAQQLNKILLENSRAVFAILNALMQDEADRQGPQTDVQTKSA